MEDNLAEDLQATLTHMVQALENDSQMKLPELSQDTLKCFYSFAYNFYQNGKYQEALSFFRFLTLLDVQNAKYWMGLGAAQQMLKDYEKAIQSYKAAMVLNENDPYVYFLIAECYFADGKVDQGLKVLTDAEQIFGAEEKFKPLVAHMALLRNSWKKEA